MEFRFQYNQRPIGKSSRFPSGMISRPHALVYLKSIDGNLQPIDFLVDSGTDLTILPFSVGDSLGREVMSGEAFQIRGIKGALDTRLHEVEARLGDREFHMTVAFAEVDKIDGRAVPALLGRTDVFDVFDVLFRQRASSTTFSTS